MASESDTSLLAHGELSLSKDKDVNSSKAAVRDSICARCSRIVELLKSPDGRPVKETIIYEESAQQLIASCCSVCRFLGESMNESQSQERFKSKPPPTLWIIVYLDQSDKATAEITLFWDTDTNQFEPSEQSLVQSSQINYETLRSWIRGCTTHDIFQIAPESPPNGMRVIRCDGTPSIVNAPEPCDYVALSYVWGNSQASGCCVGDILASDIPQTIKDSIEVTLQLGYQYLWVDRYCIDQCNEKDKIHQIRQMGHVYANAEVTLVAAAGADPSHGLPGVLHLRKPFNEVAINGMLLRYEANITDGILCSEWASRGWTLQETYFSRRRLFFTEQQVVFMCNKEHICEYSATHKGQRIFEASMRPRLPDSAGDPSTTARLIEMYSQRTLRYHDDALDAIRAMLSSLTRPETGLSHFWSIPFHRTGNEGQACCFYTFWRSYKPGDRRQNFPSWAPLGWTSSVDFKSDGLLANDDSKIQIWTGNDWKNWQDLDYDETERARLSLSSESRFLRVTAYVFHLNLVWIVTEFDPFDMSPLGLYCTVFGKYLLIANEDSASGDFGSIETVVCAALNDEWLLLLKPMATTISSDKHVEGAQVPFYERIGAIDLRAAGLIHDSDHTGIAKSVRTIDDGEIHQKAYVKDTIRFARQQERRGETGQLDGRYETFLLG